MYMYMHMHMHMHMYMYTAPRWRPASNQPASPSAEPAAPPSALPRTALVRGARGGWVGTGRPLHAIMGSDPQWQRVALGGCRAVAVHPVLSRTIHMHMYLAYTEARKYTWFGSCRLPERAPECTCTVSHASRRQCERNTPVHTAETRVTTDDMHWSTGRCGRYTVPTREAEICAWTREAERRDGVARENAEGAFGCSLHDVL